MSKQEMNMQETKRQYEYIAKCKEIVNEKTGQKGKPDTFCVVTFGCQMNARDSEKLEGILLQMGYQKVEDEKQADVIVYNTCTVRENANLKVYGRLGHLKKYKENHPDATIVLCGCMMQEEEVVKTIRSKYKHVDIIFGTHNIFKFAELMYEHLRSHQRVIDIWDGTEEIVEDLPSERKFDFKAGVNIMFGCNNFCSYCIVPYVRGRERSRQPEEIIKEIEHLVADGVVEIMLLGQNVNSYGKNLENPITFAQLLQKVEQVEGLKRIRFMTSHPKDMSDELIEVMKNSKKICKHMHLPIQSGSSRVLEVMNRHYTKEHYLGLVSKLKKAIPDISLTTDIIVGFPGETEEDFEETLNVVKEVEFDSAYTFIYSKRTGTKAAIMEEQVPEEIVKNRFNRLLETVNEISTRRTKAFVGKEMEVLVESIDDHDSSMVTGRLSNNMLVHFKGDVSEIGDLKTVRLDEAKGFYFIGEVVE